MEPAAALGQLWASARPQTFAGLMSVYESNYRRLLRLIPEKRVPFDVAVSRSELDHDLHLQVVARDKYTLTLRLTYRFADAEAAPVTTPDLLVRLYHDAGLAEAMDHVDHAALPRHAYGQHLADSWRRNLLLNKWLDFLLGRGHGFALAGRPRAVGAEV